MTIDETKLSERFEGCLLGLAVGDAFGAKYEGHSAQGIRAWFLTGQRLMAEPHEEIRYTDDTQMAIAVAEALVERGEIVEEALCRAFTTNYVPARGYGRGTRAVLDAIRDGGNYQLVARQQTPGGSFGNGAAMRVAPVGLVFRDDHNRLWEQARLSALPTHLHPLGVEGAQLLALAVALCSRMERFDRDDFFAVLLAACKSPEYRTKIAIAAKVQDPDALAALGNGIEALHSVPTAIASFALTPDSYADTVSNVILLGGDTDTMAAMAGALCGAYLGSSLLPSSLVNLLERGHKGRAYIQQLASQLFTVFSRGRVSRVQ